MDGILFTEPFLMVCFQAPFFGLNLIHAIKNKKILTAFDENLLYFFIAICSLVIPIALVSNLIYEAPISLSNAHKALYLLAYSVIAFCILQFGLIFILRLKRNENIFVALIHAACITFLINFIFIVILIFSSNYIHKFLPHF
jgi:hypothetical protein